MESKAMNIFDSLITATSETASIKGASLSVETENPEFALLIGQSMQVEEAGLMNFTVDGAEDADIPEQIFGENNKRIFAKIENVELPDGNATTTKFGQLTAETGSLLTTVENKETPLSLDKLNQKDNSELIENLLQSRTVEKKLTVTINSDDNVKPSSSNTALNPAKLELQPGLPEFDYQKDSHRQLDAILKDLNAKEVQIGNKLQPEKTGAESVAPLLGSDQLESFVRSNIKRASVENRATVLDVKDSQQGSEKAAPPIIEKNLTTGELMKKQNELVIEKEANAQKGLEKLLDRKIGGVNSNNYEVGNLGKNNLSSLQPLTQFRTTTEGNVTETVKIVLPENFKLNKSLKTQTIMIRIEPDHLGPARLELKMTDEILSAKLIVETVEAKTILENSISQLREKLASADIKIENLEINVRSESHNSHLFDKQQAHWQNLQNQKAFRQFNGSNENMASNEPAAINTRGNLSPQYAGAGGVNLLA